MGLRIRPFSPEWREGVRAFNARLRETGMELPEDPAAEMLPGSEMYLAADDGQVRGGYILRPQQFSFRGEMCRVAHYRLPLSEGIIDKRYAHIGGLLLRDALQREPLLYALGMGGFDHPLPRMLRALGWNLAAVPFYFHVVRPARFLRGMPAIRSSKRRAMLLDAAAATGAGWVGLKALQFRVGSSGADAKETDDFGGWTDEIWEKCRAHYGTTAVRDAQMLRELYPAADRRFLRLRVNRAGWAVLLDSQMQADRYFGDLRVGTIVDCFAAPEDAPAVIGASQRYLQQRGVDLIISNQSHPAWTAALNAAGFLKGPSNFVFAASKALAAVAGPVAGAHINRGDGDGPIHL